MNYRLWLWLSRVIMMIGDFVESVRRVLRFGVCRFYEFILGFLYGFDEVGIGFGDTVYRV